MSASTLLYRLWGKTNEIGQSGGSGWQFHPAICHMIDVGYVAERWLEVDTSLQQRLARLADITGTDETGLKNTVIALVALHDLGKLHSAFQVKSQNGWDYGYGKEGYRKPSSEKFDHGRATAIIFIQLGREHLSVWQSWMRNQLVFMVAGHHGRLYPHRSLSSKKESDFPELNHEIPAILEAVRLVRYLFDVPDTIPDSPASSAFAMFLAGFTSVCDWLGSDSTVYPFASERGIRIESNDDCRRYLKELRDSNRAETQLREFGLLSGINRTLLSYEELFPVVKQFGKRPLQRASMDVPFAEESNGEIAVVEAPMGMGKTEIALHLAHRAMSKGRADGLYFALPTQASSNALLARIVDYSKSIRASDSSVSLVLAHGGRKFVERYKYIESESYKRHKAYLEAKAHIGSYRDEASPPSEIIATAWLNRSKRSLLATIGVGTVDQAMIGAITARHSFVRLFGLSGKVVVFDEIHAYDAYMNEVIFRLLEWLGALHVPVVLLSATLPDTLRRKLLGAYHGTKTSDTKSESNKSAPYPQIVHSVGRGTEKSFALDPSEQSTPEKRIQVRPFESNNEERTVTGAREAVRQARNGGCVAWIRNTVREAQDAWSAIRSMIVEEDLNDVDLKILHSRFTRADRNAIESNLIDVLGRNAGERRPAKTIVVATQVIEQSVDIDFDAMISDLAPIDLLLQRIGRCWRHDRPIEERDPHERPVLTVLCPTPEEFASLEFGPSKYVYDREILARSCSLLKQNGEWAIPDSCRELVSALYDLDEQHWTGERLEVKTDILDKARVDEYSARREIQNTANHILMPSPDERFIEMRDAVRDDGDGERIELSTRLGGRSCTIVLLESDEDGTIRFSGQESRISPIPQPHQHRKQIDVEESIQRASVSFPCYSSVRTVVPANAQVRDLTEWWSDLRPFDGRHFVLLDATGVGRHPDFIVQYARSPVENAPIDGLKVSFTSDTPIDNAEPNRFEFT